jgi:hypothetical protein
VRCRNSFVTLAQMVLVPSAWVQFKSGCHLQASRWCSRSWYHVAGNVAARRRGESCVLAVDLRYTIWLYPVRLRSTCPAVHPPGTHVLPTQPYQFICKLHFPSPLLQPSSAYPRRSSVTPPVTNFISGSSNEVSSEIHKQHVATPRMERWPVVVCHVAQKGCSAS